MKGASDRLSTAAACSAADRSAVRQKGTGRSDRTDRNGGSGYTYNIGILSIPILLGRNTRNLYSTYNIGI